MRILLVLFIELILGSILIGQVSFVENGVYGFKQNGSILIAPKYDYATNFSEGLACVKMGDKWGYINAQNDWVLKPQFDKAQPLHDGVAKVLLNNKYGLINSSGEIWVEPIYQKIEQVYQGYELNLNGKKGYVRKDWSIIPAIYADLYINEHLVSAKVQENHYDIYDQSALIIEDCETSIGYWDINKANEFIVKKGGKYGIYNLKIGWVKQPIYAYISRLNTVKYQDLNKNNELVELYYHYALFDTFQDDVTDQSYLEEVSNQKFRIINGITHELIKDNLTGYKKLKEGYGYNAKTDYDLVGNGVSIKLSELLDDEYEFFNVTIARKKDIYHLIDTKDGKELLVADEIKPFQILEEEFDDFGSVVKVINRNVALPFVIVKEDASKRIYNIKTKRFISENWSWKAEFSIKPNYFGNHDDKTTYLIECKQPDKYGYLTSARADVITTNWESAEFLPNKTGVIVKPVNGNTKLLYSVYQPSKVIVEANELISNANWGEGLVENDFQPTFVVISQSRKMGLVTSSERMIEPKFDTLIRSQFPEILITKMNGLYGIVNAVTAEELEPRFKELPDVQVGELYPRFYVNSSEGLIGINGGNYPFVDVTFTADVKDKKWGIGYYTYEEGGDEIFNFTVPPVYNFIQDGSYQDCFVAQNKKGDYGIISPFGDTIIPFEYKGFGEHDLDIPYEFHLPNETFYSSYSKKGVGLVSNERGAVVPAKYKFMEVVSFLSDTKDVLLVVNRNKKNGLFSMKSGEITPLSFAKIESSIEYFDYESDHFYVENDKGKKGIINAKGDTLLPIVYDEIIQDQDYYIGDIANDYTYRIVKGGKRGVWSNQRGVLVPAMFDQVQDFFQGDERDYMYFACTLKSKVGAYNYFGKEILPCNFEEISQMTKYGYEMDSVVLLGKFENKYYANSYHAKDASVTRPFSWDNYYDDIIGSTGLRINIDESLTFNLFSGEQIGSSKDGALEFQGIDFNILFENGKYGASDFEGNVLVSPEYDEASFMEGRADVMIGYQNGIMYYIYPKSNQRYTEEEW